MGASRALSPRDPPGAGEAYTRPVIDEATRAAEVQDAEDAPRPAPAASGGRLRLARAGLEDLFGPAGNSIGFLRFALAATVVVHHSYRLSGHSDPLARLTRSQVDLGIIAVAGFFALSGLLIARSADRARSPLDYLWHRVLRIFPGFWVCLVVCAALFGPLFWLVEHRSLDGYLSIAQNGPVSYVLSNATLAVGQTQIDNVLAGNPYPLGMNGSLWTLPYEFAWYLMTGALAVFGLLRRRVAVTILLALLVVPQNIGLPQPLLAVPGLGYALQSRFALAFCLGILAYLWRERIVLDDRLVVVAALVGVVSLVTRTFPILGVAALAYGLLWAAWRLPLRRFDARRDISYGLYIYAFPVQQGLALAGVASLPIPVFFAASLLSTIPFAVASYELVEGPALRLKHWRPKFARPRDRAEQPISVEPSGPPA
jgi:peptidoglycan/LPS O-acetylase OafA/YrhL